MMRPTVAPTARPIIADEIPNAAPPNEAPMPVDPDTPPRPSESPQPTDPVVEPAVPEVPQPTEEPEFDPFDEPNFPV